MAAKPKITEIYFAPMSRNNSHVGFVSFLYNGEIAMKGIGVHEKLDKSGYRLVYPENPHNNKAYFNPINKEAQKHIETVINEYLQGVIHDQNPSADREQNFNR